MTTVTPGIDAKGKTRLYHRHNISMNMLAFLAEPLVPLPVALILGILYSVNQACFEQRKKVSSTLIHNKGRKLVLNPYRFRTNF